MAEPDKCSRRRATRLKSPAEISKVFCGSLAEVREHYRTNAERWLRTRPQEWLRSLLRQVITADDRVMRRGAVRYLSNLKDDESARQLCGLMADPDRYGADVTGRFFQYYASATAKASCPAARIP
jgi:hypothetical protein